jgi:SAM-dependent methyltransferase
MNDMLPDWQLPPGTDRGLWDYFRDEPMVRAYDESLAGSPLLRADVTFCDEYFPTPGRLIDLGCGTGRLLSHFAAKGYDCLGVDLSDAMLEVADAKRRESGLPIRLLKANLVELDAVTDASIDYAACLFSTFGMIRGVENRRRFLGHIRRILKPAGVFVLHVHNRLFRFGRGLGKKGKEKGDRTMPQAHGGAELTLHHFTRREAVEELREEGFAVREVRTVGLNGDGRLRRPWLLPAVRSYGFLIAAVNTPGA